MSAAKPTDVSRSPWTTKARAGGCRKPPSQPKQRRLVAVRRQAADGVDARAHRHVLAKQPDLRRAVDDLPPQRAAGLEPGEHDGTLRPRQVEAQVVLDATRIAHAARRDDHGAGPDFVDRHRILRRLGEDDAHAVAVLRLPRGEIAALAIERRGVARGDLGRTGGERRVDEDRQRRGAAQAHEIGQHVEHFLRAADGEGGNHDIAARQRPREHAGEFVVGRREVLVQAIAIGRFDHQHVGVGHRRRVGEHRPSRLANVAGEDELAPRGAGADPDFRDRRAEDVSGIAKAQRDARLRRRLDVVSLRQELAQAALGVGERVQRLRPIVAPRVDARPRAVRVPASGIARRPLPVALPCPLVFLFLDVRAVGQHHPREIGRRRRGDDRSAEAPGRELRQQTRVVDVGVGEDDEVERGDVEVERAGVALVGVTPALEHPAVDEKPPFAAVDAIAGAGHLAGSAEEGDGDFAGEAWGVGSIIGGSGSERRPDQFNRARPHPRCRAPPSRPGSPWQRPRSRRPPGTGRCRP